MGASLSWFAMRGKSSDLILQDFGLKNAGKECCKTPFSGGMLPGGWFLVIHGRHEFLDDEARHLSRDCELIACFVEEHVMFSRSAQWKHGEQIWSVTHNSEEGLEHLAVEGTPPEAFARIRERLTAQQEGEEGVDYIFNIPVDLAEEITGYSYASDPGIIFENFVKRTFLDKLLGR